VLNALDLTVEAGERLVVAGHNGAGKSTLLRIIAGVDSRYEGSVTLGHDVSAAYFSQDSAELIKGGVSVLADMEGRAPTALTPKIRDMLGAFLFHGDDVYKSLDVLSGGEKSRLALLKLFLHPANLLILDEPTNHLDLYSKDILLEALQAYTGPVIFVSHDRSFMEALSTKTLELRAGERARLFWGGYGYYLGKVSEGGNGAPNNSARNVERVETATDWERDKRVTAEERRRKRAEEALMARIDALEAEKAAAEGELAAPEVYSNGDKARAVKRRVDEAAAKIEAAWAEWEALLPS
jgi:ATP-binding cassette subfamily F protein 3